MVAQWAYTRSKPSSTKRPMILVLPTDPLPSKMSLQTVFARAAMVSTECHGYHARIDDQISWTLCACMLWRQAGGTTCAAQQLAHRFDDQMSPCPRIVACRPSSCLQPRRDAQERNHGLPCDLDHAATLSDCESKQSTPHKHTTGSHSRRRARARRHVREPTANSRGSRPHHLVMPYPPVVPSIPHIGSPTRVKDRACTPPCQAVLWVASGATAACSWELNHLEQRRRACVDGQQVVQRDVAHSISI